jgi:hypothetical protein
MRAIRGFYFMVETMTDGLIKSPWYGTEAGAVKATAQYVDGARSGDALPDSALVREAVVSAKRRGHEHLTLGGSRYVAVMRDLHKEVEDIKVILTRMMEADRWNDLAIIREYINDLFAQRDAGLMHGDHDNSG